MEMKARHKVDRPATEVFEFFSDASNNPLWQKGMVSCKWTSDGAIGVGSTYAQEARFMGRSILSEFVVTEYEPGHKIAIETTKSTFPIQVTRWVEPINQTTCWVNARITGGPTGLIRLMEPLMRRAAQRSVSADYARLVELMGSQGS